MPPHRTSARARARPCPARRSLGPIPAPARAQTPPARRDRRGGVPDDARRGSKPRCAPLPDAALAPSRPVARRLDGAGRRRGRRRVVVADRRRAHGDAAPSRRAAIRRRLAADARRSVARSRPAARRRRRTSAPRCRRAGGAGVPRPHRYAGLLAFVDRVRKWIAQLVAVAAQGGAPPWCRSSAWPRGRSPASPSSSWRSSSFRLLRGVDPRRRRPPPRPAPASIPPTRARGRAAPAPPPRPATRARRSAAPTMRCCTAWTRRAPGPSQEARTPREYVRLLAAADRPPAGGVVRRAALRRHVVRRPAAGTPGRAGGPRSSR